LITVHNNVRKDKLETFDYSLSDDNVTIVMAQISTPHSLRNQPDLTAFRAWDLPHVVHGFMTRQGGVSSGSYHSFNLAEWVGDDAAAVDANWERWRASYPKMRVARLQQVHGNQVHTIGCDSDGGLKTGDAMVTAAAGFVLAVFTADCVPVLMVDAEQGVVAALHAGWRGVLANIASAGVHAMMELGAHPNRIRAALGPSIGLCCFEVDTELAGRFMQQIPSTAELSRGGRPGKMYLDLRGITRSQLQKAGLTAASIANIGPCTRCANDRFFSRRAAGGVVTGLQMSFVGLAPEQLQ
jgi:YfiH family protein